LVLWSRSMWRSRQNPKEISATTMLVTTPFILQFLCALLVILYMFSLLRLYAEYCQYYKEARAMHKHAHTHTHTHTQKKKLTNSSGRVGNMGEKLEELDLKILNRIILHLLNTNQCNPWRESPTFIGLECLVSVWYLCQVRLYCIRNVENVVLDFLKFTSLVKSLHSI
jgi:hypothetical protein